MHLSVGADRSQPHSRRSEHVQMGNSWSSLLTEGNTAGVLVSDHSVAGHTLGYTESKTLYKSIYMGTEHCIDAIW